MLKRASFSNCVTRLKQMYGRPFSNFSSPGSGSIKAVVRKASFVTRGTRCTAQHFLPSRITEVSFGVSEVPQEHNKAAIRTAVAVRFMSHLRFLFPPYV